MRLIDADALKEVSEIQMADFNSIEGVRAWIDRQPTVYDVEKVVEQIHEAKLGGRVDAGIVAIDIVRGGRE